MSDTMMASQRPANPDMNSRKNKKPLMEKRRRARINSCLSQLKSLVLQAIKKDSSQFSKLEKADILELTVKHLRALQRQQAAGVMQSDPSVMSKYRAGFNECAQEVMRYIHSVREVNDDVKERVISHLGGCLQMLNADTLQPPHAQHPLAMKPLHVHIPTQQGLNAVAVMHPQVQAASLPHHALAAFTNSSPVSVRGSPPAAAPSPVYSSVSSLSMQPGSVNMQSAGAFKIVPSNSSAGAVALYLGQTRDSVVSVDALPLYSVSIPNAGTPVSVFTPPSSTQVMDVSYASSISPVSSISSASSPRLTPPFKLEPASSSLPVDLRQSHKVKASFADQGHHPMSFSRYSSSALSDEKLWRPW